jgi:arylamine N-acetyltransferase
MREPHDIQTAVDLFFDRYGTPTASGRLADLTDLLGQFARLPYENLTKIMAFDAANQTPNLRRPLRVMEDHLELGTGGTCFSLTELLRHLTAQLGFTCYPVMAHMRHGANIHCALRLEVEGRPFLVDPGYLVRHPLALSSRSPRPKEDHPGQAILVPAGSLGPVPSGAPAGDFDLFTLEEDGPRFRYRFSDRAPTEEEFLIHWKRSFFQVGMRSLLVSSRSDSGEFQFLHNHKLRRVTASGKKTQNVRSSLDEEVRSTFGIDPSVTKNAVAIIRELREKRPDLARGR